VRGATGKRARGAERNRRATKDIVVMLFASSWKMKPGLNPQLYTLRDGWATANWRLRQISPDHRDSEMYL